jgi:hypothetical protein
LKGDGHWETLMRRTWFIACLCLVASVGCDRKAEEDLKAGLVMAENPKPIDPAMEPKLQALATSACHCEQTAKNTAETEACWVEYYRAGKASISSQYASACAPVSAAGHTYNSDTPQEFSIHTGSSSPVGKLCTGDEITAVETAWKEAFGAGLSGEAMQTRMRKALADLKAGRQVAMTGGGCGA